MGFGNFEKISCCRKDFPAQTDQVLTLGCWCDMAPRALEQRHIQKLLQFADLL
ncbi:hypothetical protein AA103581_0119 [Gluconobacter wancherniae NBRC 103581]|nr:hypothetical protein AA103581_0119 [Gluconobacter wancherniae NBRC 103581]